MTTTDLSESQTVSSERKVVRGGSFFNGRRSVRCACRYGVVPDFLDGFQGFRPVVNRVRKK